MQAKHYDQLEQNLINGIHWPGYFTACRQIQKDRVQKRNLNRTGWRLIN